MKWFESTFRVWEDNCSSYSTRLLDALNKQRDDGTFCDVSIKVGNEKFPAHRGVLCAASGYFQGLLDGNFKEHGATDVDLTDAIENGTTMSVILDYIYTGKLLIERRIYEQLLAGVSFLLLEDACQLMASFLLENLVLENCADILLLADRYSLHELSSVAFEVLSSRLHDYFIHDGTLENIPIRILSRLADIHAFDCVAEEDVLSFMQSYLHNYAFTSTDKRAVIGEFLCVAEFFKEMSDNVEIDAVHLVYETFLLGSRNIEELKLKLSKHQQVSLACADESEKQQEVVALVSVQLLDRDRVTLTIHAYLTESSKWIRYTDVTIPKKDHRTFKDFVGFHSTGDLLFSTDKRMAFVKPDGHVSFVNSCCFICSQGIEMECSHSYFCVQGQLFTIVPSLRRTSMITVVENLSDWEATNLAYVISMYDCSERDWVDVGEFGSDDLLRKQMEKIGADVSPYPEFHFDIHSRDDCTWILASLKTKNSITSEGNIVEKNGGEVAVKVFKLITANQQPVCKLVDVHSSIILRNIGARQCSVRSTCGEDRLYVQPTISADDPAFKPEILYYSGPMYVYDLKLNTWSECPLVDKTKNSRSVNLVRHQHDELCNDGHETDNESKNEEAGNRKVFNVTFTSTLDGKECKENGSIAPSPTLPLVEFKQRRKVEHEQLIRGTHSGRHIDTYQRKVYATLTKRTELLSSAQHGTFYQVHVASPLITELWQYNTREVSWQYLPAPPVDTNIMHISVCSIALCASHRSEDQNGTLKTARFTCDGSNYDEFRPFTNYHLKKAHEMLFSTS